MLNGRLRLKTRCLRAWILDVSLMRRNFSCTPHARRKPLSARTMRASDSGFRTAHSLILRTVQPSRRRDRVTLRSRRLFVSILFRQNSVLVCGKYLHEQPCQKQPSTNTATFRPGHAKSGLPATGQCFRYPRMPAAHRSLAIGNSVVVLPRDRTAAMILERISFVTWSIRPQIQFYRLAYSLRSSGLIWSEGTSL
jgi:hypothetical protein